MLAAMAGLAAGGLTGYWFGASGGRDAPVLVTLPSEPGQADAGGTAGKPPAWGELAPPPGLRLVDIESGEGERRAWVQVVGGGLPGAYVRGESLPGGYEVDEVMADRLVVRRQGQRYELPLEPDADEAMAKEDAMATADEALSLALVNQMIEQSQKMVEQMRQGQQPAGLPRPQGD